MPGSSHYQRGLGHPVGHRANAVGSNKRDFAVAAAQPRGASQFILRLGERAELIENPYEVESLARKLSAILGLEEA